MNVRFAFPLAQLPFWLALGLAGIGVLFLALRVLEGRRRQRMGRFVDAALAPRLLAGYDARVRRPLFWLTLLGFAFLALAFAQPRWGQAWMDIDRGSRDVLLLLDTSESMNAVNPLPNRLERARQKVQALLELCPSDRFGLIPFSGNAVVQCPLTLDHAYLRSVLKGISTDMLSEEGTDIAAALRLAADTFEADAEQSGGGEAYNRAIVLISDGEEVSGDAVEMARRISEYGTIYVIGIGDPEGAEVRFPEWMLRRVRVPDSDKPHLSKLDEDTLSKVAVEGGGIYVRSTPDTRDVEALTSSMENLRSRAVEGEMRFRQVNRYRWPLAAALVCFAAEGLWLVLMPIIRRWWVERRPPATEEAFHG